jgi:Ca2+-binding EF-hand superfamily protein
MERSDNTLSSRREAANKAEMAFKVFDKDNDGFITKDEFQKISKKLSKEQVNTSSLATLIKLHSYYLKVF